MSAQPALAEHAFTAPAWRTLGASVRGAHHRRDGLPNQDAMLLLDGAAGRSLAVVADGHGGSRHFRSAVGARLAVAAARDVLWPMAASFERGSAVQRGDLACVQAPRRIVARWAELARAEIGAHPIAADEWKRLQAAAGPEAVAQVHSEPLLAYGATLLFAFAMPDCLVLGQLGDGDLLIVDAAGNVRRPVPRDERLVGHFTTSICHAGAAADLRCVVREGALAEPSLVLLATDGLVNSFHADADVEQVARALLALLQQRGASDAELALPGWLDHATHHGSGDDITLAMMAGNVSAVPVSAAASRLLESLLAAAAHRSLSQRLRAWWRGFTTAR